MRNFVHLGLGQVTTTILTVVLNAAVARALSLSDLGLMYLLSSIATFAYVIVDWGHGPYIIREAARHPEKSGELLGSALALRVVVALFTCAAAVGTTWILGYDVRMRIMTAVLIIGWLPQYLALSFGWIFRSHERMDLDAKLNVMLKVLTLSATIACLALGGRVQELIFAWSAAGCVTLVIAIAMYRRLRLPRLRVKKSTARALLRGGVALFAMALAVAVEPFLNANILYKLASPAVVGWYGAAWAICGTLLAPATIIGGAMYPRLSSVAADRVEFKRVFDISFRPLLLCAVLGAVGTYLFAEVPIALIYGREKFGPAADMLRAFSPAMLLLYIDIFLSMAILAGGTAARLAGAKIASIILTTLLVFVLVPIFQARFGNGGLGIMYAMIFGELLMFAAIATLIRDTLDRRTIADACRSLVAGVITVLLFRSLPSLSPFVAIPMCVLVFGGISLLVGAVKKSDVMVLFASRR